MCLCFGLRFDSKLYGMRLLITTDFNVQTQQQPEELNSENRYQHIHTYPSHDCQTGPKHILHFHQWTDCHEIKYLWKYVNLLSICSIHFRLDLASGYLRVRLNREKALQWNKICQPAPLNFISKHVISCLCNQSWTAGSSCTFTNISIKINQYWV